MIIIDSNLWSTCLRKHDHLPYTLYPQDEG